MYSQDYGYYGNKRESRSRLSRAGAFSQNMQQFIRRSSTFESRLLVWRLLTLVWAAHIFFMSTASLGGEQTRSVLAEILYFLHVRVSADVLEMLNTLFRKLAHLTEYAVFAFLLYRSMGGRNNVRKQRHLVTWCIVAAAAYSLTDEFHQSFVRGRNASLIDCGIDTTGAAIAMLVVYCSSELKTRRTGQPIPIQARKL